MLWRDDKGLHFAWNPVGVGPSDMAAVITTIHPETGEVEHRLFPNYWVTGVYCTSDGIACLSVAHLESITPTGLQVLSGGALIVDQNNPSVETYVKVTPENGSLSGKAPVDVGWDGEAFALYFRGTGLEVSRVSAGGDILLPPTTFAMLTASNRIPGFRRTR